ncbi:MAG: aminotransferase class III-fold pyridoxal phosphate-dependent enzyme [Pelagibacteraceae bacterium]
MGKEINRVIPNSLNEHWMPFSSNRDFKENPRLIIGAKGVYLKDHLGRAQIDASSGLYCNPLGHGRKEIISAITKQLEQLDYCQPFQQGFGGSFELATKIASKTPGDLNKIFYTICGSTAVETAIKIAFTYQRLTGNEKRYRFVGREKGYHGMNIGAMSVGGMANNIKGYDPIMMPGVLRMRHTHLPEHQFIQGQPDTGAELANDLEKFIQQYGADSIAACVVEPISGSVGILVPPKGYLKRLREICDQHKIILIFDEVVTGWGRTGSMFAAEEFNVTPDIMTLAKATTNGIMPMGVVAIKDSIYDSVVNQAPKGMVELFHGYTYSGIPAAVAAALAVQDIFEKENILQRVRDLIPYFLKSLFSLKNEAGVENIRGYGLLGAIDLSNKGNAGTAGFECFKICYEHGINLKSIGDSLILAPPFICNKEHIDEMMEKLRKSIKIFLKK